MKIAIIGPGALGSLFAAFLAGDNDNEVWLLDHDPQRAARINAKLLLTDGAQEFFRSVSATADAAEIGRAELVLHCVKSRDVVQALRGAVPLFTPQTSFISFQNGISHIDELAKINLPVIPAIGVTSLGATLVAPGHVRHGGKGLSRIGFLPSSQPTPSLDTEVSLFNRAGLQTEQVANILDFVWAKLLINIGINALTVIFDCNNGALLEIKEAGEKLELAVQEGVGVAHALGITFTEDPVAQTLAVCRATANNISSMLQDVRRKKPTEIGAINGALLEKAARLGMKTPVNEELVSRVRKKEGEYLRTAPHG